MLTGRARLSRRFGDRGDERDPEGRAAGVFGAHTVPLELERVLRHCLVKDPAERFQSIGDVAFYLEALAGSAERTSAAQARAAVEKGYRWLGWSVAAVLLLLAIALTVAYFYRAPAEARAIHFSIFSA